MRPPHKIRRSLPRRRTLATLAVPVAATAVFLLSTTTGISGVVATGDAPSDDGSSLDEPVAGLSTVDVQRRDLAIDREAVGAIEPATSLDIVAPADGRVLSTLEPGDVVTAGSVIARIDDRSVVAIGGVLPMWRDLSVGDEGDDVTQLETALVELGFDPDGNVTIDDEFTDATAAMVRDWQTSLGTDDDGSAERSEVVVISESMQVSDVVAGVGASVGADDQMMQLVSDEQVVTAEVAVADSVTLAVGDAVALRLPDRTEHTGTVQSVARGDDDAVRSVVVAFDDGTEVPSLDGVSIDISWTTTVADDVLTLPADTFRHVENGTYVVDVLDVDGSIRTVPVEIGASVGSFVEVIGVAEGTSVLRP